MYSSGFASGSIGGRQPGPPAGLLPARLGQVLENAVLHKMLADYCPRLSMALAAPTGAITHSMSPAAGQTHVVY